MLTNGFGTRSARSAQSMSGNGVTTDSKIAICTEIQDLAKMPNNRIVPSRLITQPATSATGVPRTVNGSASAPKTKGNARYDRRKAYPVPNPEAPETKSVERNNNASANQPPRRKGLMRLTIRIKLSAALSFTRASSRCIRLDPLL